MGRMRIVPRDEEMLIANYSDLISVTDHPVVEIEGVYRWEQKPLVRWLGDHVDLNDMWCAYRQGTFTQDAIMQFYRDIGYSLSGFAELDFTCESP